MISESINSVGKGTTIAAGTAKSLSTIVDDFDNLAKIISEIALASSEQAESIGLIANGITQISAEFRRRMIPRTPRSHNRSQRTFLSFSFLADKISYNQRNGSRQNVPDCN